MIPKPSKREKEPKPLKRIGKVGRQRQKDRRAKLKADPPNHEGYFICYLCHRWITHADLEHEQDASTHPELRSDPSNHKWACTPCNIKKKRKGGI